MATSVREERRTRAWRDLRNWRKALWREREIKKIHGRMERISMKEAVT
jgi:hypothetical protein